MYYILEYMSGSYSTLSRQESQRDREAFRLLLDFLENANNDSNERQPDAFQLTRAQLSTNAPPKKVSLQLPLEYLTMS